MSSRSSGGLSDGAPSPPERSQGWDIRLSGHIDSSAPKAELGALAAHHLTTTHLKTHCPYRCGGVSEAEKYKEGQHLHHM